MAAATERLGVMRVLVDQLFEYAKAVSDDRALTREPVDVADVLGKCLAELYPSFVERGWAPEVAADEAVEVLADREALTRIVENVLGNCLRHGSGAPRIELRGENGFALSISNEAEGLETLDASRLFERFYRGDAARSTGGSGLGLSIAADLARAMGMSLEATVADGRFTVTLWK